MLNEPTIEKLKALRLDAMASAWSEQQKDAGATKLVLVPATPADLDQLERLRQEVAIPLEAIA